MRIAICDDEITQIDIEKIYINSWASAKKEQISLYIYTSAEEFLFNWQEECIDLVFLDIKMKKMSGTELANIVHSKDDNLIIIFVTGYVDYVFESFRVNALNYLVKPISEKDIHESLDNAVKFIARRERDALLYECKNETLRIKYYDIISIESSSHHIEINTNFGQYRILSKIKDIEKELPSSVFYRCHRSYIVNLHYIKSIFKKRNLIILDNNKSIPVSRGKVNELNEKFLIYYRKYKDDST